MLSRFRQRIILRLNSKTILWHPNSGLSRRWSVKPKEPVYRSDIRWRFGWPVITLSFRSVRFFLPSNKNA